MFVRSVHQHSVTASDRHWENSAARNPYCKEVDTTHVYHSLTATGCEAAKLQTALSTVVVVMLSSSIIVVVVRCACSAFFCWWTTPFAFWPEGFISDLWFVLTVVVVAVLAFVVCVCVCFWCCGCLAVFRFECVGNNRPQTTNEHTHSLTR